MRVLLRNILAAGVLAITAVPCYAQYTYYKPMEGFGIEVSLSNSGRLTMPMYRNSIASLTTAGDHIVGGTEATRGLSPYIFVASLGKRELVTLKDVAEVVKGQSAIRTGFVKATDGALYAGTMAVDKGSGHLLQVNVDGSGSVSVTDLGMVAEGEGIFALTGKPGTGMLYGVTYPSGVFFSYHIASKSIKKYDTLKPTKEDLDMLLHEYHEKPERFLCAALTVDEQGRVYGSRTVNKLFRFDPADETFTDISDMPEVWGRRTLGQAESWVRSDKGLLYGGNAGDGQLFTVDPTTKQVRNLGKPTSMHHLRGLSFGADGKLYGLAGALPGYAHLFSYDAAAGFTDLGNPQFILKAPGIEQGIEWRGFQLRTITASEDGKYIIMGEDEALSQLLIFPVGN